MPKLRTPATGVLETSALAAGVGADPSAASAISRRAYELWVERGCPEGSPEQDWYKAESELKDVGQEPETVSG